MKALLEALSVCYLQRISAYLFLFTRILCCDSTCTFVVMNVLISNPLQLGEKHPMKSSHATQIMNVFTAKSLKSLHKITFLFMSRNVSHLTDQSAHTCQERATQFGEVVCLAPHRAFCEFTCAGCSLHVRSQNCWTTFLLFVFTRANCSPRNKAYTHTTDETLTAFYSSSLKRDRNGNSQT
jgi:hypothetical protein